MFSYYPIFKMLSVPHEPKPGVFKFLRFETSFRKASFSWRISVDGRPNRRNGAPYSNYSGVYGRDLNLIKSPKAIHLNFPKVTYIGTKICR